MSKAAPTIREMLEEREHLREAILSWVLSSNREDADQKLLSFWEAITKE